LENEWDDRGSKLEELNESNRKYEKDLENAQNSIKKYAGKTKYI